MISLKSLLGLRPKSDASAADIQAAIAQIEREHTDSEAAISVAEQNAAKLLLGGTDNEIAKARAAVRAAREIRDEAGGILDALRPMLEAARRREVAGEIEALHAEIAVDEAELNAEFVADYPGAAAIIAAFVEREKNAMAKRARARALTESAIASGAAAKEDLPPLPATLPIVSFGGRDLLQSLVQLPDADGRLRTAGAIFPDTLARHTDRERREHDDFHGRLAAESHARQLCKWEEERRDYLAAKGKDARHQSWTIRGPGQMQEISITHTPEFAAALES